MQPQSTDAKVARLLSLAARHLETVDPNSVIGEYSSGAGVTPQFAENAPGSLSLLMVPGGHGSTPQDHVEGSIIAARTVVGTHLGRDAQRWIDERTEPARARSYHPHRNGGVFGSSFDRYGVAESVVGFDLSMGHIDSLVPALHRLARTVLTMMPGFRPSFTMVRCGRSAGTQQVTFDVEQALPLTDLKPLMTELGIGNQHGSLMSSVAFLLGARFTLPANTSQVTIRPIKGGVEMRLDVMLEAIQDPPPQLLSLLRLLMTERPRSLQTLDRWLSAFTLDGFPHAGDFTVLSVWVRPDVAARVALYLRPAALDESRVEHPAGSSSSSPWDAPS